MTPWAFYGWKASTQISHALSFTAAPCNRLFRVQSWRLTYIRTFFFFFFGWGQKLFWVSNPHPKFLREVRTVGFKKGASPQSLSKLSGSDSLKTAQVGWGWETFLLLLLLLASNSRFWSTYLLLESLHSTVSGDSGELTWAGLTNRRSHMPSTSCRSPPHTFCFSLSSLTCFSLCSGHPSPRPIAFLLFICQQHYHGEAPRLRRTFCAPFAFCSAPMSNSICENLPKCWMSHVVGLLAS